MSENETKHGGARPRAGRKYLNGSNPGEGQRLQAVSVTLPAEMKEALRILGDDNISAGIRIVYEFWKERESQMINVTIKQENGDGKNFGGGVYVNAYIVWQDDAGDNPTLYASECVPFGQNTDKNIQAAEKRVKAKAIRKAKKEYVG